MNTSSFSSHIPKAWKTYKSNWKFIVPAAIVTVITYVVLQVLSAAAQGHGWASFIVAILSIIVGLAMSLGWSQIALKLMRSGSVQWADFKTSPKTWVHYFLARIIYSILILIALVILLVPMFIAVMRSGSGAGAIVVAIIFGIIGLVLFIWLSLRFMFISLVAVDQPTMRGWGIVKASWRLTKRHAGKLFLFALALLLLNIVGAIAIGIGLFVSVPVSIMAVASVYNSLKNSSGNSEPAPVVKIAAESVESTQTTM